MGYCLTETTAASDTSPANARVDLKSATVVIDAWEEYSTPDVGSGADALVPNRTQSWDLKRSTVGRKSCSGHMNKSNVIETRWNVGTPRQKEGFDRRRNSGIRWGTKRQTSRASLSYASRKGTGYVRQISEDLHRWNLLP